MRTLLFGTVLVVACCVKAACLRAQPNEQSPSVDIAILSKSFRALLGTGKTDEATALFKKMLAQAKTPTEKKSVREEYLREMAHAGKPLDAYRAFPGGKESFAILAEQLVGSDRASALAELMSEHETYFDDDPQLLLYRGQVAYEKKDFARADGNWSKAFKEVRDEFLQSQFHHRRVRAGIGAGKVELILEIPPASTSFHIAADYFAENREMEKLEKLLDAAPRYSVPSFSTSSYRLRLNEKADAATLLKLGEERFSNYAYSFLAGQGRALEAYQAATDAKRAFQQLSIYVLSDGDLPMLRKLIEAHRQGHADDPEIHRAEGKLYFKMGLANKAVAAFKKADGGVRRIGTFEMYDALYQSGLALKGYEESGFDTLLFVNLGSRFVAHGDATGLQAWLKARPEGKNDVAAKRAKEFQMDLALLNGKVDDALAMFLEHRKELEENTKKKKKSPFGGGFPGWELAESSEVMREERDFAKKIASAGKGLEFYRVASHQKEVFAALAMHYRRDQDAVGLEKLLKAHAEKFASDTDLAFHRAVLNLMRGNVREAEMVFRAELAKPEPPKDPKKFVATNRNAARLGLYHAYVRQGKTVEQYRIAGSEPDSFLMLAQICVFEKATRELEALVAAHRKANPKDPRLRRFEGEAAFLKGDYTTAWDCFKDARRESFARLAGLFRNSDDSHSVNAYTTRDKSLVCLVRLKRHEDAVKLALDWEVNSPSENPIPLILAHAAAGDVKQTLRLVEAHARNHIGLADFYRNEDLGPLLRSDAMRQVRERFPDPAKQR